MLDNCCRSGPSEPASSIEHPATRKEIQAIKTLDVQRDVAIEVACDVDNPLVGADGASRVYGPQKGATPAMARTLDANLAHLADVVQRDRGVRMRDVPGAGAAGGLGGGPVAFAGARLCAGVDVVMECVGLARRIRGCSPVITGEGRMDGQTVYGKTPAGVARAASDAGIPCIALCGSVGANVQRVTPIGIDAFVSALEAAVDEDDLPSRAPAMLERCAEQVGRLLSLQPAAGGRFVRRTPARTAQR